MNSLSNLYPGIDFSIFANSFLTSKYLEELNTILQPSMDLIQLQYGESPNIKSLCKSLPNSLIEFFEYEKYLPRASEKYQDSSLISKCYYFFRPILPVSVRSIFQRHALRNWHKIKFPNWPCDTTADDLARFFAEKASHKSFDNNSFVWFWPGNYSSCLMLTHDVETLAGLENCHRIMDIEEKYGFRSSFQIVPEKRYPIDKAIITEMKQRGFEVCIHGLNHDGSLFRSRQIFESRLEKIRTYADELGAKGFRSPVLYRNPEWIAELGFSFDMSFPNVGHLDPQRGGCCTVFPFFNGDTLELPLTTIQDYSLFSILNKKDIEIWKMQIDQIVAVNGLISFIVHPDYIQSNRYWDLYKQLLTHLSELDSVWHALPCKINAWWRARAEIKDVRDIESLKNHHEYRWNPQIRSLK